MEGIPGIFRALLRVHVGPWEDQAAERFGEPIELSGAFDGAAGGHTWDGLGTGTRGQLGEDDPERVGSPG